MQDFSQIIGHESIIKHLQNAIKSGKTSHAYIFHGEEAWGRSLFPLSLRKLCSVMRRVFSHATNASPASKPIVKIIPI